MENLTINGRYRILQQIGVGGFGLTYLAEDWHLPTRPKCVVKHLKPQINDEETLRLANRLFQQEAEILYRLGGHPNIPSLIAHFKENGEFYLVQEFIEGHTIDREFAGGRKYNQKELIQLLGQVLEILAFVHSQNVIHRDIKPANLIRRASDGNMFLIDFGAVKQVNNVPRGAQGSTFSTITIGSHGYMAMEQMAGNPNFSSDLYALGLVAIQSLTGIKPLELPKNQNTNEFIWTNRAQVSPEVEHFITKLVRYDFRQRFFSANEALKSLNVIASRAGFFQNKPYPQPLPPPIQPAAFPQNQPPVRQPVQPQFHQPVQQQIHQQVAPPVAQPIAQQISQQVYQQVPPQISQQVPHRSPPMPPQNPIPSVGQVNNPVANPVETPAVNPLVNPVTAAGSPVTQVPPANNFPPNSFPREEILPTIIVPLDGRTNFQQGQTFVPPYDQQPGARVNNSPESTSGSKIAVYAAIFFMVLGGLAAAAKIALKIFPMTDGKVAEKRENPAESRKSEAEKQRQISEMTQNSNPSMLYQEAETQAEEARLKEKNATTRFEWEEISKKYERASNLLASIDQTNPNYSKAQPKIQEYKERATSALERSKIIVNGVPVSSDAETVKTFDSAPVAANSPARAKLTMPGKQSAKNYIAFNSDSGYDVRNQVITSDEKLFTSKIEAYSYGEKDSKMVVIDAGGTRVKFKPPSHIAKLRAGSYSAVQELSSQPTMNYSIGFDQFYCSQGASHSFTITGIVYDELYGNVSYLDATFMLSCENRKLMGRVHYDAR
jgi:serine/threonine protein kinase